ncbi:MAG: TRAP transporter small permease subunit [Candidatus Aminicenantes bacterium]|nr:TRAP transporter small permease subunit [Candidatus Aminicenantes bacterium]
MRKIYRWICNAEKAVCGVGFVFLIAFVFLSAILRFFRFSMSWNIDLAMLLLAWTAFLGADVAWRSGQIKGVDILTRNLPGAIRYIVELIVYIIILGALIIMFIFGIRLAWSERVATYQSMPIPYSLVTLSLIVASFSMIFTTLQKIRRVVLVLAGKSATPAPDGPPERSEDA